MANFDADSTDTRCRRSREFGRTQSLTVLAILLLPICYFTYFVTVAKTGIRYTDERLSWSDAKTELVALRILDKSVHYELGTEDWGTLLPSGQHIVYVDDDEGAAKPHSVTLFHQLRCLDILQSEYAVDNRQVPSPLANHCFNYLRQMILCQMDVRAEAQFLTSRKEGQEAICRDWTAVYKQAEQSHKLYLNRERYYMVK